MSAAKVSQVIAKLEQDYATFYDLTLHTSASGFLLQEAPQDRSFGLTGQGGVFFREQGDDIDIGLLFSEKIVNALAALDPHQILNNDNLNAFCVIVEEVSHFHLILTRKALNMSVTRVELEWQAEIDKLLFCAALLYEQNAFPHYHHLFRIIYDRAKIVADPDVYEEATRHAARLWSRLASQPGIQNPRKSESLREILQQTYRATWQEKLQAIDKVIMNG